MMDREGYAPSDEPHHSGNYGEGHYSYGSYEQRQDGNYGGVDPNIVDYDDTYNGDGNGDYGLEPIEYGHYDENGIQQDGAGPGILLSILETALEDYLNETLRTANNTSSLNSPRNNHREHLEPIWKAIRTHWLWAHDTVEERSIGARRRNDSGLAPLHLICKLASNPPTDILEEIVAACPQATEWEDDHGWLPLHHACMHGASTEVLKLLTSIYPRSKIALDAHNRTPLHLYATRGTSDPYNPKTLAINFGLLCAIDDDESYGQSPAEIQDRAGMLPMHYACAYGTTQSVLNVLDEAFPYSLEARDDHGRTPLHFVMVNAQRSASPGVLGYLLGHYQEEADEDHESIVHNRVVSVNVRDGDGNLPLHLLNLGLVGADFDQHPEKLDQLSECLTLYLDAEPHVSTDFLAALQVLPDPLRDVGVVHPHVRRILNAKIIQRFPTSILMLDGIMLVTMIVCFELATTRFVDQVVDGGKNFVENGPLSSPLIMLYVTAGYFFLRELIQVIASLALGALNSWLYDTTNWLDVLVIALVTYYTTIMTFGDPHHYYNEDGNYDDLGGFRTGTALTKGVLWTAVIFFLKSTQVDFAVFLNGVFYVVRRLVAFLLAILVILISFAQMFWLVYLEQPVCKFSCREGDTQCETDMEGCNYPHCEFGDSFLKVYTMMMGEIGTETRYDQNLVAQILYIFYGFFIVILLSNVLIAIVTDSYEIVQNDRAAIVFWSNRLDFVAEMDSIASVVRKRIFCWAEGSKRVTQCDTQDDKSYHSNNSSEIIHKGHNRAGSVEWFRDKWTSIVSMFENDVYTSEDIFLDFWYDVLHKTLAVLVIPPWLILGFVTVGILWPPQVREWLFVQKDARPSRAEIERQKLEQLQDIQRNTKLLKEELKMEMQHDRDEMFRMKAEVDAVQEEVLADLHQVNVLVTTLLTDLGGIPLEG